MSTTPGSLTRRHILTGALGLGGAIALGACGSGSGNVPGQAPAASGGGGATGYSGPKVSLAFWNGFTGGDGPFMEDLVNQFMDEHDNITTVRRSALWDGTNTELNAVAMAHLEVFVRASLREPTVEAYEKRIRSALSPDEETQQLRKYSQALVQMLQNPRMPRA